MTQPRHPHGTIIPDPPPGVYGTVHSFCVASQIGECADRTNVPVPARGAPRARPEMSGRACLGKEDVM